MITVYVSKSSTPSGHSLTVFCAFKPICSGHKDGNVTDEEVIRFANSDSVKQNIEDALMKNGTVPEYQIVHVDYNSSGLARQIEDAILHIWKTRLPDVLGGMSAHAKNYIIVEDDSVEDYLRIYLTPNP